MKKVIPLFLVGMFVASCTEMERSASLGAGGGAIVGGLMTNSVQGAAVGAALGGAGGALFSKMSEKNRQCYERDRYNRRYLVPC
ncbi:hypothetical protein B488_11630 [Liberibacter crescens BT-1]|uniref:Glycine zipper domain-containing protein n=1 Tax=Liberibacter crescens (strain BT-1) TaxID=1215343 RepID=L0EWD5_LIBCB|nr:glycine zipper domain-containing protein [Liberibacter crescens]AGA65155.1 hypothetical protein B488_11630 [Liberibacter crescens BT-1]AMC13118.1 membrane protein [Liberibacter crescens]